MNKKKPSKLDRLDAVTPMAAGESKNQKTQKLNKPDGRKNNRGIPGKAGRKAKEDTLIERGIKQWLDDHVHEEVTVSVRLPDGKVVSMKKPRIAVVLQKLYEAGVTNGSVDALKAWLDRALGKAVQPISGAEDAPPIKVLHVDF